MNRSEDFEQVVRESEPQEDIMTQHTPGPWTLDPRSETHVIGRDKRHVCTTGGYASTMPDDRDTYIDENAANARLIAAAPELLSLVERAKYFATLVGMLDDSIAPDVRAKLYSDTRAAIAKATGG